MEEHVCEATGSREGMVRLQGRGARRASAASEGGRRGPTQPPSQSQAPGVGVGFVSEGERHLKESGGDTV